MSGHVCSFFARKAEVGVIIKGVGARINVHWDPCNAAVIAENS